MIVEGRECNSRLSLPLTFWYQSNMEALDRITRTPGVMGGKACIRGMRVTVGMVVGQVAAGRSFDQILDDFPYLQREDIVQSLSYAALRASDHEYVLAGE